MSVILASHPGRQLHPRPTARGTLTAIVVRDGSTTHTDRDHRVRVQFPWQRGSDAASRNGHPTGSNAVKEVSVGDNIPARHALGVWLRGLFVHAAMAQVNDADSLLLAPYGECEAETLIRQRIDKAKSIGLEQREDLALYCVLSLQFPPGFEKEAPFAEAIGYRAKNKPSFGAVLDEVSPDVWSQWDERLKDKEVQ